MKVERDLRQGWERLWHPDSITKKEVQTFFLGATIIALSQTLVLARLGDPNWLSSFGFAILTGSGFIASSKSKNRPIDKSNLQQ